MNVGLAILAGAVAGVAYQADQIARMVVVELPRSGRWAPGEAAGVVRVVMNRARARRQLPTQVITQPRGGKYAVWTLKPTEYQARMRAVSVGDPRYRAALSAIPESATSIVGDRTAFLHLATMDKLGFDVPVWATYDPITIGATTFSYSSPRGAT